MSMPMAPTDFIKNPNPNCIYMSMPRQSAFCQVTLPERISFLVGKFVKGYVAAPSVVPPPVSLKHPNLPHCWREIQGSNNWVGLVKPLNPLLRDEIIRYGELVLACYKAFDLDPTSKRYLNCKYGRKNMLKEVGMEGSDYEVTKYIYATPDINFPIQISKCCGRWIGYIAVATDDAVKRLGRRDVLVTFRGTVTNREWIANFMSSLAPARLNPHGPQPDVKVESGFLSLYTSDDSNRKFGLGSCREQVALEVSRLMNKYKGEELSITAAGHSMGSSLAILLAYDIAELGLNRDVLNREVPITVYSFAGPRVGNIGFKKRCEELGIKVLRVVNGNDPVIKLPGVVFNEKLTTLWGTEEHPWSCSCYAHVGVEVSLDFFEIRNPLCVHDLDSYIRYLKCPEQVQLQKTRADLRSKQKEWLLSVWSFNSLACKNVATSVGILINCVEIYMKCSK